MEYFTEDEFEKKNSNLADEHGWQRHFYLERLGIPLENCGTNFCDNKDPRFEKWRAQRYRYGFDERETWNMDGTFVQWLYEHVMMYKEYANADTSQNIITIDKIDYTFEECIDNIVELLEAVLVENESSDMYYRNVRKAIKIFREIIFLMWW